MDADAIVGNRRRAHWIWTAAAIAGGTAAGWTGRAPLPPVAGDPGLGPARTDLDLFRVRREPGAATGTSRAYDLRQLGGESTPDAADRIVVRATVHNRAQHAQPVPMIRVVLQDRFGNALSTHAIGAPGLHERSGARGASSADQRVDAELSLEDPNHQAVGFELDACLPDAARQLHCSNDL